MWFQSLIGRLKTKEAQKWLKDHGYKYKSYEITENYYRFKQKSPRHYKRFRIIEFGKDTGIKAVIGFKNPDLTFNPDEKYNLIMLEKFSLEDLERDLKKIDKLIEEKDTREAAEKIYMIVESCIKILSELKEEKLIEKFQKEIEMEKDPEGKKFYENLIKRLKEKKWNTILLDEAANELNEIFNEEKIIEFNKLLNIWKEALYLHTAGFHENMLTIKNVIKRAPIAKEMLEITKKYLEIT